MSQSSPNRFYTIMIIPEKTTQVRKILIPAWIARGMKFGLAIVAVLAVVMIVNYGYVMNQVSENNELRVENRRLRQQVQTFRSKMDVLESNLERVKVLSTKLKVITGSEDRGGAQALMKNIPDANDVVTADANHQPPEVTQIENELEPRDPERQVLQKQYLELDAGITTLTAQALVLESTLQDQFETLVDQKAFLAALPTRKPAVGYFTSGFGIRKAPLGGKVKMHEGLDIANHPGTPIKATADGTVTFADAKSGYGQTVIIDHGYGLETWYAHTRKILVTRNQRIRRGENVALLGNSGRSTGPHVHYEVRVNGIPVDPLTYILEN